MKLNRFIRSILAEDLEGFSENPTARQLVGLLQRSPDGEMRGLIDLGSKNYYVWPSKSLTHGQAYMELIQQGYIKRGSAPNMFMASLRKQTRADTKWTVYMNQYGPVWIGFHPVSEPSPEQKGELWGMLLRGLQRNQPTNEAVDQDWLYHGVRFSRALTNLRTNSIRAARTSSHESEPTRLRHGTVSLTRDPRFAMTWANDSGYGDDGLGVVFVLDRNRLRQNYKIRPQVEQGRGRGMWSIMLGDPGESEERLWGGITPLTRYLVGVYLSDDLLDILAGKLPRGWTQQGLDSIKTKVLTLVKLLRKNGIRILNARVGMVSESLLVEKRIALEPNRDYNREFVYLRDPSPAELLGMLNQSKFKTLRGILAWNGSTYWWDAADAIHVQGADRIAKYGEKLEFNTDRFSVFETTFVVSNTVQGLMASDVSEPAQATQVGPVLMTAYIRGFKSVYNYTRPGTPFAYLIRGLERMPSMQPAMSESFGGYSKGAFWVDPDGQLHEVDEVDGDYDHAEHVSPGYKDEFADPQGEDFDLVQEERQRIKDMHIFDGWVRMEFDSLGNLEIEAGTYPLARRAARLVLSDSAKSILLDLGLGSTQKSYRIEPSEYRRFLAGGWKGIPINESFKIQQQGMGLRAIYNSRIALLGGMRSGSSPAGMTREKFMIYLRSDLSSNSNPEPFGEVHLMVRDGTDFDVIGLQDIKLNKSARGQGLAGELIREIIATTGHGLEIYDIKSAAVRFWSHMGAKLPDGDPLKKIAHQNAIIGDPPPGGILNKPEPKFRFSSSSGATPGKIKLKGFRKTF